MKRSSRSPLRRKGAVPKAGAILFLVVGALSVLSILSLGATSSVIQELRLARMVAEASTSFYDAFSVSEAMKVVWANDPTPSVITLYDLRPRAIPFGDKTALVIFNDEQARIPIDRAPRDVVERLPGLAGQTLLVDAIVSADITVKQYLFLLEGMTQEIYDSLKDVITVYGDTGVNINTAAPEAFAALGMDSDLIAKIQESRKGIDGQEATQDDNVFTYAAEIVPLLGPYGLTEPQRLLLESLISSNQLTTASGHVALHIVLTRAQKALRTFHAVVSLSTGKFVSWEEV